MHRTTTSDWARIITLVITLLASACVLYAKLNLLEWRVAQVENKVDQLLGNKTAVAAKIERTEVVPR